MLFRSVSPLFQRMLWLVWSTEIQTCRNADCLISFIFRRVVFPMRIQKKSISIWLQKTALSLLLLTSGLVCAQNNAIKIIVGYPPGATSDILTRILADGMSKRLNQPVIVENRAGAGGQLGNLAVKADRKSTRLNSSHPSRSRMPSSA